jgi:hypothetical protein
MAIAGVWRFAFGERMLEGGAELQLSILAKRQTLNQELERHDHQQLHLTALPLSRRGQKPR